MNYERINKLKQNKLIKFFIPKYNESELFSLSILLLIMLILNREFLSESTNFFFHDFDPRIIIALLIFIAGWGMSVYEALVKKRKTELEKYVMAFYAVYLSAIVGFAASYNIIENTKGWMIIFPILNIINVMILIIMIRARIVDDECVSDRDAGKREVLLSFFILLVIFIVCEFFLHLYWAITFSIAIFYTTNISKLFDKFNVKEIEN